MKSITKKSNTLFKTSKKFFAGGGEHSIDHNLKDFDVLYIGGINAANACKYNQHTGFHGTMAAFNPNPKFYNEHHYEYYIHGNMKPYKYLTTPYASNFNINQSLYVPNRVVDINPNQNKVTDDRGNVYTYKTLVLNTGLNQKVSNMDFVNKHVQDGEYGESRVFVHQPSSDDHIDRNRRIFAQHKDNDFIIYLPKFPSRREAYDAWYLGLDTFLSWGVHSQTHHEKMKIRVITPNDCLFKMPFANEVVNEEISQRTMIETHFGYELVDVEVIEKGPNATLRYGTFKSVKTGETLRIPFGTLLLTPENKKRQCYENNDITNEQGEVRVNPYSLQHVKYPNIFAFGDCADVDTTKSFYAALNQQAVARTNIKNYLEGKDLNGVYEGYSSFAVNHSIDRQWIFSHKYGYKPTFGNFYVPRWMGLFVYKFKNSLELQMIKKIYNSKPGFGYPYMNKDKYFRPLDENRFLKENGLTEKDVNIHKVEKLHLSTSHH